MPSAHLTQASLNLIAGHAGKLDLMIQKAGSLVEAVEDGNEDAVLSIAQDIASLWSRRMSNDCCDIFKQLYNRQRIY